MADVLTCGPTRSHISAAPTSPQFYSVSILQCAKSASSFLTLLAFNVSKAYEETGVCRISLRKRFLTSPNHVAPKIYVSFECA